jgi:hypothetical protein
MTAEYDVQIDDCRQIEDSTERMKPATSATLASIGKAN